MSGDGSSRGALLLTFLLTLPVLLVFLGSVLAEAWPVLAERGLGFLGDNLSDFDSRAGVRQGFIGSLVLISFVARSPFRSGSPRPCTCRSTHTTTRVNRGS